MIIGLGFHYVRQDFTQAHPGIFGLTPGQFKHYLMALSKEASFISQSQLREVVLKKRDMPEKAWLITFDDGLREQFELALPILDEMGIPAVFFASTQPIAEKKPLAVHLTHILRSQFAPRVLMLEIKKVCKANGLNIETLGVVNATTQYAYDSIEVAELKYLLNFSLPLTMRDQVIYECFDRMIGENQVRLCEQLYMNDVQLMELAQRDYLGSHCHSHRPLGGLTSSEIKFEIENSIQVLAGVTGFWLDSIAYPYGSKEACPFSINKICDELGITMGFTMERAMIDTSAHPNFLPRFAPNDILISPSAKFSIENVFKSATPSSWF